MIDFKSGKGGKEMQMNHYQQLASRTAPETVAYREHALNFTLGLAGETGETVDYLKKVLFHGHEFSKETLEKELGDILWYVSQLARVHSINLDDIAYKNIEKLKKRYPDGFETEKSIHRVE
jgi:NTP pyrophosphatase (non-canonical NTP hydrolase)